MFYHYSAITCAAPTIANGNDNCASASSSFGTACTATCDAGFTLSGTAAITCQDSDGDGTGDFGTLPTCSGMPTEIIS